MDRLDPAADVIAADPEKRRVLRLERLEKEFWLLWQDLAASAQGGMGFEVGPAAVAAIAVARQEDEPIFRGKGDLEGLMNARGTLSSAFGDWDKTGAGLTAISQAVGALMAAGLRGPFAAVMNPVSYAKLLRPVNGAQLELKLVEQIANGGVFQTPVLTETEGIVVSNGRENLDLAVGQDLVTAYIGPAELNHVFHLVETVALRIKRPSAICVLKG